MAEKRIKYRVRSSKSSRVGLLKATVGAVIVGSQMIDVGKDFFEGRRNVDKNSAAAKKAGLTKIATNFLDKL